MGKPIALDIAYLIIQYKCEGNIAMLIWQVILMSYSAICGLDTKTVQNMWQFCKLECRSGQFFLWKKGLSRGQKKQYYTWIAKAKLSHNTCLSRICYAKTRNQNGFEWYNWKFDFLAIFATYWPMLGGSGI